MSSRLLDGVPVETLEQRIWPGRWSPEGYLREGDSLVEVIDRDRALAARLGLGNKSIADNLAHFLEQAQQGEWAPVNVGNFRMTIYSAPASCEPVRGSQFQRAL